MPREISGLRIARSFVTPAGLTEVQRTIDFQLGSRQGIAISAILGGLMVEAAATTISASVQTIQLGVQTLHLETGSLETVPDQAAEDEDTIDSEVFYRQDLCLIGNDDLTTEFRSAISVYTNPTGLVSFEKPILTARNITHRGINSSSTLSTTGHVIIYYTFVEFSLAELGLILARRQ